MSQAPSWNLDDLYKGITDSQIAKDLNNLQEQIKEFSICYEGNLQTLSAANLAQSIQTYEHICERLGRISSFASLIFSQDMSCIEGALFYQRMKEKISDLSTGILFFPLEVNTLEQYHLEALLKQNDALHYYHPWLQQVRAFKEHQLSKEMETLLHEKSISSRANWIRLYDETLSRMRTHIDGKEYDISQTIDQMTDPDEKIRQKAAQSFGHALKYHIPTFSLVMNTLIKDKEIEDKWRQYKEPISYRNKENFVEDAVVESLLHTVQEYFPRLSHRYYKLKAQWMGKETLPYWDRNAPLPDADMREIPWDEAKNTVLRAYRRFSPEMASIGQEFFDKHWIDAALRSGKDTGAFSHPCIPSVHPYILQNYHGKTLDVMTLAHELGHGIHQVLSAPQGYLMADTPLTLAETASIFGEMLTFQSLLETSDAQRKKVLLAAKVGDMLNSIVRQIAFCLFEKKLHAARKEGELSADQIGGFWMETQRESLGPSIIFEEEYQYYWGYISHFFHVPFYVYAYAFGNCLVNSLYAVYEKGMPDFAQKYVGLLQAGGTIHHQELLQPFGLDTSNPDFWRQGLDLISHYIDELEAMP